jgi:hypothetical protein
MKDLLFGYASMPEACAASVNGVRGAVARAIMGEQAKPEYFGDVSDAKIRCSHLATISLLASKSTVAQKEALIKGVCFSDAVTFHDFVVAVKEACTADSEKPVSTGKGATRAPTENVVKTSASKIAKAVSFIAEKKKNDKKKMRDKKVQADSANDTAPAPEAITERSQWHTALGTLKRIAGLHGDKMTKQLQEGFVRQMVMLESLGDRITK